MRTATTQDYTVWECDALCGTIVKTANAFTSPDGWWLLHVQRIMGEVNMRRQTRTADACSKDCAMSVIQWGTWKTEDEQELGYRDRRLAGAWTAPPARAD